MHLGTVASVATSEARLGEIERGRARGGEVRAGRGTARRGGKRRGGTRRGEARRGEARRGGQKQEPGAEAGSARTRTDCARIQVSVLRHAGTVKGQRGISHSLRFFVHLSPSQRAPHCSLIGSFLWPNYRRRDSCIGRSLSPPSISESLRNSRRYHSSQLFFPSHRYDAYLSFSIQPHLTSFYTFFFVSFRILYEGKVLGEFEFKSKSNFVLARHFLFSYE